ncbi:hypothetical protein J7L18_02010, partial [Candidatus Bathyarchaeota archaeon]|nr:hypothetical protein [Candidatus Bathyarchaeota archaeon]
AAAHARRILRASRGTKHRVTLNEAAVAEVICACKESRHPYILKRVAEAVEVVEAAEERAVYFICKCGIRYKIDFEEKTIEKVTERERSEVFQSEFSLPAVLEVECPRCHARGKVDVHDAKVEWILT